MNANLELQPVIRLANLWNASTREVYGGTKHPLTPKQLGQLKMLRSRLGYWARFVIDWTISNWAPFAKAAKSAAGLASAPPLPHIGFLLCHYHIAVGLMTSAAKAMPGDGFFKTEVLRMEDDFRKKREQEFQAWRLTEDITT